MTRDNEKKQYLMKDLLWLDKIVEMNQMHINPTVGSSGFRMLVTMC